MTVAARQLARLWKHGTDFLGTRTAIMTMRATIMRMITCMMSPAVAATTMAIPTHRP